MGKCRMINKTHQARWRSDTRGADPRHLIFGEMGGGVVTGPSTGSADRYRVGRKCPWNIYRIDPASDNRDNDERFGVVFNPEDGPRVAAAMNAWVQQQEQTTDDQLRNASDGAP
jgi:hypothetical protein